jgi:Tfp pilus assembly protein PilF
MKNITFLSVLIMLALSMQFCRNKAGRSQQDATDLMSARTLGLAYLEEFKLEEAEKEFLKFIDLAPEDKFGYANLGLTYLRMGNYPEAEKQLRKAMEIDSTDADIRLILSTVFTGELVLKPEVTQVRCFRKNLLVSKQGTVWEKTLMFPC